MPPLSIHPPFTYSYQCGSALLTSYLPVYMYSVSLQMLSIFLQSIMIFYSSHLTTLPFWWMDIFPGVYWPMRWNNSTAASDIGMAMVKPHKIISFAINNTILLFSFGLCSPVLGCYITLSLCVNLCFNLLMIGRFISWRLEPWKRDHLQEDHKIQSTKLYSGDPFIYLLNQQVEGAHASFQAGKWPVIFTSTLFITLLCWDMVGDQVGWYAGLWVPFVGFAILLILAVWERVLVTRSGVCLSNLILSTLTGILHTSPSSNSFELPVAISSLHRPQDGIAPSEISDFTF
jgi:hypothetical protein